MSTAILKLLNPLLNLLSDRLVCTHYRLFVDNDFGRVSFWSTDSRRDRGGVRLHDDAVNWNKLEL